MQNEPTNVRLRPETIAKIKAAADLSGEKSADIMRLAMELGLARLEAVNFDLQAMMLAGVEAAERAPLKSIPANEPERKKA